MCLQLGALVALDQLLDELPELETISVVVSWFGDDLRCAQCQVRPGVEYADKVTAPHVWTAGGEARADAYLVGRDGEGRPIYGGTPSDGSKSLTP